MKKFFTLLALLAFGTLAQAQTCVPDSSLIGSAFPVQPLPYNADTGEGGISDSICINKPFEFAFQAAVGDTFSLGALTVNLDSIRLATTGAIGNLPPGLDYNCNPPNCVFKKNTIGCILISGTVTDPQFIGNHSLTISTEVFFNNSPLGLPVVLPAATGATSGEYILAVREEGSQSCEPSSTEDPLTRAVSMKNVPNPFSGQTVIEAFSHLATDVSFEVYDMMGKTVHRESVSLFEGKNTIPFDGSSLTEGIYFYALQNQMGTVTGKMVVSK